MLIQEHVVLGEIMFTHWTTLTITLCQFTYLAPHEIAVINHILINNVFFTQYLFSKTRHLRLG